MRKETAEKLGICLQTAYPAHHLAHAVAAVEGSNPNTGTALDNLAEGFMLYFGRTGGGAYASSLEYDTDHRTDHAETFLSDISGLADDIRNGTVSQQRYQNVMKHMIVPFIQAVEKYTWELQFGNGGAEAWAEAYAYWSCIRQMFPDGDDKDMIETKLMFEGKSSPSDVDNNVWDVVQPRLRNNVRMMDTFDVSPNEENQVFNNTNDADVKPGIDPAEDLGFYVEAVRYDGHLSICFRAMRLYVLSRFAQVNS